jgi:hypothetical protein
MFLIANGDIEKRMADVVGMKNFRQHPAACTRIDIGLKAIFFDPRTLPPTRILTLKKK